MCYISGTFDVAMGKAVFFVKWGNLKMLRAEGINSSGVELSCANLAIKQNVKLRWGEALRFGKSEE